MTGAGRRMGRPPSARASLGGRAVTVRLSAEEHALLQAAADRDEVTVAEFLRTAGLRSAVRR